MTDVAVVDDDLLAIEALGSEVEAWLEDLPEPQRDAVVGRVLEDLPYDELAARSGVPTTTVRQRVARGLAELRARSGSDR